MHTNENASTWCGRLFGDYLINWQTGEWRSCCKMTWDTINSSGDSPWNLDKIQDRQHSATTGIRHADCSSCWKDEDRGILSFRNMASSSKIMNRFILNLGNTCNLACTYCWSSNSSIWANKTGRHPIVPIDIKQKQELFWKWWDASSEKIERIIISGGEPSLMAETYTWLDRANLHDKEILFNTNVATNQFWWNKFLESIITLSKTNKVIIRVSMDAIGDKFEWIRTRLSWPIFEKNLLSLIEISRANNIQIRISPTLSCLTLEGIVDVADWVISNSTGIDDVLELDSVSMISDPFEHRPDPWAMYFKNDLEYILNVTDVKLNKDLISQLNNLLSKQSLPTDENKLNMISALDNLETTWKKPSWKLCFPRLAGASS